MSNNGKGAGPSWAVVILVLFIFWPAGLYLLVKKLSSDKKAAISTTGGTGMKVLGIILIAFGSLAVLGCMSSEPSSEDVAPLIMVLFMIAGGIALLVKAKKIKKEAKSIKEYLSIIVNGNVRQLDSIATTTGKSYDVVYNDVKKMIDKGYLKNAYIDEGRREVVLPGDAPVVTQNAATTTINASSAQTKIVACPCCGANNTIVGNTGECEYCGSPLK